MLDSLNLQNRTIDGFDERLRQIQSMLSIYTANYATNSHALPKMKNTTPLLHAHTGFWSPADGQGSPLIGAVVELASAPVALTGSNHKKAAEEVVTTVQIDVGTPIDEMTKLLRHTLG